MASGACEGEVDQVSRVWLYRVLLVLLLVAFVILQLTLLDRRSMMIDDVIHIPSGYSYLKTRDFRLNEEHPPFIKLLSAVGLTLVDPELPLDSKGWAKAEEPGDPDDGTNDFCLDFFQRNAAKFEQISYWGRVPVIFVPVLLAIVVWIFTRHLFGERAAILSAFLLLSEPNVIANSSFVQDDVASALALIVFVIALRAYLLKPAFLRALLLGLALAFGLLVKHSLAVLVPIAIVVLIAHAIWRRIKYKEHLCRYLGLGLITIACCYLIFIGGYAFGVSYIDDDEAVLFSEWLNVSASWAHSAQDFFVHLPILLPRYYLWGMDQVVNDIRNGRTAFLLGQVSETGWWYYFPVAFVLKTAIPFLLLTVLGIAWTAWDGFKRRRLDAVYLLLPPLGYLGLAMTSHMDIGLRHILPVFPFFAIIGGWALTGFLNADRPRKWHLSRIGAGMLAASALFTVIASFPTYTSYFNPMAGGTSNGRHLLSDSNVETGQDVKDLAEYLKARGETRVEGLFIGSGFLPYYGVKNCELPCGIPLEDHASDDDDDTSTAQSDDKDDIGDENDETSGSEEQTPAQATAPVSPPTDLIVLGANYLEEVGLKPEQNAIIDQYRSATPETVIDNVIFVFRKRPN